MEMTTTGARAKDAGAERRPRARERTAATTANHRPRCLGTAPALFVGADGRVHRMGGRSFETQKPPTPGAHAKSAVRVRPLRLTHSRSVKITLRMRHERRAGFR